MAINEKEYVIICDESVRDGTFYSNFYGGVLVPATQFIAVSRRLNAVKKRQNLHAEVKWQKVTATYLAKYCSLMDAFFNELANGHARVRIMFRQNARTPKGLTRAQIEQSYFLLYYSVLV